MLIVQWRREARLEHELGELVLQLMHGSLRRGCVDWRRERDLRVGDRVRPRLQVLLIEGVPEQVARA